MSPARPAHPKETKRTVIVPPPSNVSRRKRSVNTSTMSTSQRAAVERGAEPVATPQRSGGGWSLAEAGVTIAVGYLALSAALIVVGLILVHLLAPVRHWDDHVNAWFAAHRTSVEPREQGRHLP